MKKFSGKKLQYFDPEENKSYIPYVLETSIGLDRMFLATFSNSLTEEILEDGSTRTVLRLPAVLAPTKAAVLPLIKKDGLPEIARSIIDELKWDFNVTYDEKDAVGRRYRRQDAAGTPFCITVDHQTKEDNKVTIRHRDTMVQKRVNITDLREIILQEVDMRYWLQKCNHRFSSSLDWESIYKLPVKREFFIFYYEIMIFYHLISFRGPLNLYS